MSSYTQAETFMKCLKWIKTQLCESTRFNTTILVLTFYSKEHTLGHRYFTSNTLINFPKHLQIKTHSVIAV